MRTLVSIAAMTAIGLMTIPAVAEQKVQGISGALAAEVLPVEVEGWARRALAQSDLETLFGDALGGSATERAPVEQSANAGTSETELRGTSRRGQRSLRQTTQVQAGQDSDIVDPVMRALEAAVASTQDLKVTARRGKRHNANKADQIPAFAYDADDALVVIMLGSSGAAIAKYDDGVRLASQSTTLGELTGEAFLVSQGVAFVDVSGADIDPTRTLVGRIEEGRYLLVAAQAEPEAVRAILDQVDFAALGEFEAPAIVKTPKASKSRRSKR